MYFLFSLPWRLSLLLIVFILSRDAFFRFLSPIVRFVASSFPAPRHHRGLPVFYGDVTRPEVLNAFNVGKAKAVICTLAEVKGTNTAVVNLRREFPDLPVRARKKEHRRGKVGERVRAHVCV